MEKKEFFKLVNGLPEDERNYILNELECLPERFHDEFIGDVIVDEVSLKSFRKVVEYYYADIHDELTDDEKIKLYGSI